LGEDGFIKATNLGVLVEEVVVFTATTASGLLVWVALVAAAFLGVGLTIVLARRRNSRAKRALGRPQETPAVLQPAGY
jgi:ABC-type dipeptide/oligopeptide/nickel transport system permease component